MRRAGETAPAGDVLPSVASARNNNLLKKKKRREKNETERAIKVAPTAIRENGKR